MGKQTKKKKESAIQGHPQLWAQPTWATWQPSSENKMQKKEY